MLKPTLKTSTTRTSSSTPNPKLRITCAIAVTIYLVSMLTLNLMVVNHCEVADAEYPVAAAAELLPTIKLLPEINATADADAASPSGGRTRRRRTCHHFFSIMSSAYLPGAKTEGACQVIFEIGGNFESLLAVQSKQMAKANSTLTLFTSWSETQLTNFSQACRPQREYPHIRFQQFDPDKLLEEVGGFSETEIGWIQNWYSTATVQRNVPARLSDLWRVLLARQHGLAYLDLDMFVAPPNRTVSAAAAATDFDPADLYLESPAVAVPIWQEGRGALEVQNSAFCFTAVQLDHLIEMMRDKIRSKGPKQQYDEYTDLGPMIFQHAIQKLTILEPLRFLYTTSNDDSKVQQVWRKAQQYGYQIYWFHLDKRWRGSKLDNLSKTILEILDRYEAAPLPG